MQINELLRLKGEKQSALAKELGVQQASISEWATGKKNPSVDRLIAIARYFHVTVGCVVGEEPIPEDYPNHFPLPKSQVGDPLPAYIGDKQIRKVNPYEGLPNYGTDEEGLPLIYVESPSAKKADNPPFTKEQLSYIEEMTAKAVNEAVAKAVQGIQEDTTSSQSQSQLGA